LTSSHFLVKQKNLRLPHALLDGEEHHHLSRVLRVGPGERVWLVDERGCSYRAEVEEVRRRQTRLLVHERKEALTGQLRVVLAQALIKSKNMELVIQKATELGVGAIIPVEASRSVVRLKESEAARLARWRRIAQEAAKQSRRQDIPRVESPQPYSTFVEARSEPRRLILCEDGGRRLRDCLAQASARPGHPESPAVVVLVGPEGGWTGKEKEQAFEKGFEAVSLGGRILRSETAALAVLAAISIFWGD
jgi:16S rRNA (uracil1498-N3)-methyltransferase